MTRRRAWLRALLVPGAAVVALGAPVDFARAEDAAAKTLDLTGFEGAVRLVLSPSDRLRSNTEGWRLAERQGVLVVAPQRAEPPSLGFCGTVPDLSPALPSAASARVEIAIPPSTRVLARRFAGSLESSVALVDARFEVRSGSLRLAQLIGGAVSIEGAGSTTVGEAAGSLALAVNGPGTIHVLGGLTERLKATLQGSGRIRHEGVVRRALIAAEGEGEVHVREVHDPVRIDRSGRASITSACMGVPCGR